MKDFLKYTAAVICGFLIVTVLMFMLGFGFLGAIVASGSSTPSIPKSGVLAIDMSKVTIGEQSRDGSTLSMLGGEGSSTIGIWDAVQAVNTAATDPAVKYIYLRTDGSMSGISALEGKGNSLIYRIACQRKLLACLRGRQGLHDGS